MFQANTLLRFLCSVLLPLSFVAYTAELAIVIDDMGYRPHNEQLILQMPTAISVAILPDSPHHLEIASKAHQQGREILIHLPMAPLSKQPLEKHTLRPTMSEQEVQTIIERAIKQIPYASGLNNHMGSAMTSSLAGMQKVMRALSHTKLYFLDSVTIGTTQAVQAAQGTGVPIIKRNVFLDDSIKEADIQQQLNRAIQLARKQGAAIAIGHPHPETIRVLQRTLVHWPADITLVKPSTLLNRPLSAAASVVTPTAPATMVKTASCAITEPLTAPTMGDAVNVILHALQQHPLLLSLQNFWQPWFHNTDTLQQKNRAPLSENQPLINDSPSQKEKIVNEAK